MVVELLVQSGTVDIHIRVVVVDPLNALGERR